MPASVLFRRLACLALVAGGLAPAALYAQTAGPNVNMVSGREWPGGDPFLQRQNEPSLDVSTRNPSHLVAGANDYRTVDIPFEDGLPGESNAGDAWLGLFKSLDGGRIWKSTLLPGYPQDRSPEGLASPLKGFAAAADATVRAGANGVFLYSGIAFNRGNNAPGVLFAARFIDNNDKENGDASKGRDPIKYAGTVVVDTGNAGQFLDKPTLAIDRPRPGDAPCTFRTPKDGGGTLTQTFPGGRAYIAYTVFVGGNNNLHTKLLVASSSDCGASWGNPVKVTEGSHINQGAALAIDPVTGAVTVAWRRFANSNDPNGILVARSTDGGKKWSNETSVVSLPSWNAANPTAPTLFDQGTTSGSIRTNAYPALAADGAGRLYLAWSQRGVGPGGDARIVLTTSTNGTTWSAPTAVDNAFASDDEGSLFTTVSGRGHQLMPALRFTAGKLMALYYDLRLDHTIGHFSPVSPAPSPAGLFFKETRQTAGELPGAPGSVFTPFLTDTGLTLRRHTIDVRVAQADAGPSPAFSSARVSRYVYGSRPGSNTIEQLQVNPPNLPMFKQGTAPFLGDYIDIAGPPAFVPQPGGTWAYNTAPAKDAVFHAAWTDNRDVRPPADGNWAHYTPVGSSGGTSVFDPTKTQPPCVDGQAGMRNQNIYTAKILQGLVVTTPSNAKQLTMAFPRIFATVVQNATEFTKSYRLTISNQPLGGRASFLRDNVLSTIDVSLAPRSSASRPVFITSTDPKARVTVSVAEIAAPNGALTLNGLTGSVIFNPDVSNPDVSNPDVSNPDVSNPDVSNQGLTDANYTITNNGNTSATYRVRLFGNPPASAKLQLILSKVYATPVLVGCTLTEQPQNTLVTNITRPVFTTDLTTLADPGTTNPDVSNATITLAPGEKGLITLRGTVGKGATGLQNMRQIISQTAPVVLPHAPSSNAPPNTTPLLIATTALPDGVIGQAYSASVSALGGRTPYVFSVSAGSLPAGVSLATSGEGAGGLFGAPTGPAGTSTFTVKVTDAATPTPQTATRTFTIHIGDAPAPPAVVTFAFITISNVKLNGGSNVLTLPGGGTFTLDHDYVIANPASCPGCIDQIEIGFAGGAYQACTYNGIPPVGGGVPVTGGVAGHGATVLTAPTTPGTYYLAFDYAQTFFCHQYPQWWSGSPGPDRYIGTVIVP